VRAFVADDDPQKRDKAIDRLLADSRYARHMRNRFHTMLMERLGEDDLWLAWLERSFAQNKPWDQMVRETLAADPDDEEARGAAFFVTKRLESYGQNPVDFPGLTRDVGRLFIGRDLQCAQCHDDLFVDDYEQLDFQGLHIVFSNVQARRDVEFPAVSEKPLRDKLEFISVFGTTQRETGPRLPDGPELELPVLPEAAESDDQQKQKSQQAAAGPPVALGLFAKELPSADYQPFVRNIANRLWFLMMGRGLIHPLDLHHRDNPPSHPELLDELSTEFASHAFDMKWMLGELARSKTYQRSSAAVSDQAVPSPESFLVFNEKRLSSEQLLWSLLVATGESRRYEEADPDEAPADGLAPLKELRAQFVAAFSNPPREPEDEINATVKGALFLLNNDQVLQLLNRRDGNLIDRLVETGCSRRDCRRTVPEHPLEISRRRRSPGSRAASGQQSHATRRVPPPLRLGAARFGRVLRQPLTFAGELRMNSRHPLCNNADHQFSRRQILGGLGGALGAGALGGLISPAAGETLRQDEKQVIFIWLDGGISQLESWDPKPNTRFGGPFRAIPTSVPGIHVSELVRHSAKQMHHLSILRSLHTQDNSHSAGVARINRGDPQDRGVVYPYLGSAVAKILGPTSSGLPPYVWVKPYSGGFKTEDAGFLGAKYGALALGDAKPPENLLRHASVSNEANQLAQPTERADQRTLCKTKARRGDRCQ
jgi:hypothetical protein